MPSANCSARGYFAIPPSPDSGTDQLGNHREGTMEHQLTTTGAASAPAAPITAADQARLERDVAKSRSANTRAQYRCA